MSEDGKDLLSDVPEEVLEKDLLVFQWMHPSSSIGAGVPRCASKTYKRLASALRCARLLLVLCVRDRCFSY